MTGMRKPRGFVPLGLLAGWFGVKVALLLIAGGRTLDYDVALRASAAADAALAFVTAEALLFARRWAFGASLAFAGTYVAGVLLWAARTHAWSEGAAVLMVSAIFLIPVLSYVWSRTAALHPLPARTRSPLAP